ncbi:MAG: D-alanyl-D-alanine carboxypeptidase family protein [Parcubacteria group bacterium Gr01-1014_20]|nr:MAG: D-alanyl-D-alanine carboxypeptidase family protein [Parcubacteria group bacterium Gr01-1014_20]
MSGYAKIKSVKTPKIKGVYLAFGLMTAIVVLLAYGGYRYWEFNESKIFRLEQLLSINQNKLLIFEKENTDLTEALHNEQAKNQLYEAQIKNIFEVVGELSGTVGVLKKLSQTDPELLKKYSKVYFLNEHYTPTRLEIIDSKYIYDKNIPQQIHINAAPFLERMLASASNASVTLKIASAYRSFGTQAVVKSGYKVTYGAGTANQFSAEQGYSEHQLGTALDFNSPETKEVFLGFEKTKNYKWLTENAYQYGFVLSYPPNNIYYQFEPWHWRFVGVALASKLHDENKYFYDLPQRDIDNYLVNIFD